MAAKNGAGVQMIGEAEKAFILLPDFQSAVMKMDRKLCDCRNRGERKAVSAEALEKAPLYNKE